MTATTDYRAVPHDAPARFEVLNGANPDDRVRRAVLAILDRARAELTGVPFCIVITDDRSRVIEHPGRELTLPSGLREAMRLAADHPAPVVQMLPELAVAAAHVSDPRSGRPACAVALVCKPDAASELMLSYVRRVSREVEDGLVDDAATAERALTAHFVRARRHVRGPMVSLNERTMLINAAAARLVDDEDHATLWEWAHRAIERGETHTAELALSRGTTKVRCEPVTTAGETVGAAVRLDERAPRPTTRSRRRGTRPRRATFGWASLSASQLGIAELVAEGLTNPEIAARLYISPHTVDFHLRQVFAKLGIGSRIELTRIVSDRAATQSEAS